MFKLRSYHGGRGRTCVFWLSHTSTNTTFFLKPPTTFLTCFRSERRKHAGKKVCLNWVSNSQPSGHESDMLTTEPPGRDTFSKDRCELILVDAINGQLVTFPGPLCQTLS